MPDYIEEMVERFNRMVEEDDAPVRKRFCFALLLSLGETITQAAGGDATAMGEARSLARSLLHLGAARFLTADFYEDYFHTATLLATTGEIPDTALAFQSLDDLLNLRVEIPPKSALH